MKKIYRTDGTFVLFPENTPAEEIARIMSGEPAPRLSPDRASVRARVEAAKAGELQISPEAIARATAANTAAGRPYPGIDVPEITQGMVDERYGPNARKFDLANSAVSGLSQFGGGIAKMPETVSGLADAGFNALTGLAPPRPEPGLLTQGADAVTKPFEYEPQTWPGRYTESAGEMGFPLTGPLGLAMGITSEGAEDVSEKISGTDQFRPAAGLIGALFGPSLINKALRAVSPNKIPEALKVANKFLKEKGIIQTAGQMTDNKALMRLEAASDKLQALAARQGDDFTAYALSLVDEFGGQATPAVMKAMKTRIGGVFDDVALQTGSVQITNQQVVQIKNLLRTYKDNIGSAIPLPSKMYRQLNKLTNAGKPLPAERYLEWWTQLGGHTQGGDIATQKFAHAAREILDDALQASATPENAARLAKARAQWRDMLVIRKTLRSPDGAWQKLNPARLRGAIMAQDEAGALEGTRAIGELSNAGIGIPKLPTITNPTAIQQVTKAIRPALIGGAGGGGLGLWMGGPPGAVVGSALGAGGAAGLEALGAANRAFKTSKLGQRYLTNQLMTNPPQIGGSNLMKMLLAGNQADPGGDKLMELLRGPH